MNLSIFDIIIIVIIFISSATAMYRGLIKFSIGLIAFVLSILITYFLYPFLKLISEQYTNSQIAIEILSSSIAYIIALIICSILNAQFCTIVSDISGGIIDRMLGCTAGFIRGVVLSFSLFIIIMAFISRSYIKAENLYEVVAKIEHNKYPSWLKNATSTEYFDAIKNNLLGFSLFESLKLIELPRVQKIQNKNSGGGKSGNELEDVIKHELDNLTPTNNRR